MFLEVVYKPTTLFSLKRSEATNSAGKSLISPSPYSIKMALLNAIITYDSLAVGKKYFPLIRDLSISFSLPSEIVVNNCMIKIQKVKRNEFSSKEKKELSNKGLSKNDIKEMEDFKKISDPFQPVVAFREYVYLNEKIKLYIEIDDNIYEQGKLRNNYEFLKKWFMHINYFGKKGCFFQFISAKLILENQIHENYSSILTENLQQGIIYQMDDMNNKMEFKNVNTYDSKNVKRTKKIYIFPYQQVSSNKNYTFLKQIE